MWHLCALPNLIKTLTGAHIAHLLGSYSIPNSINLKKIVLTVTHSQELLESSVVAIQTGKGFLHMFQPEHYTQPPRRERALQVFLGHPQGRGALWRCAKLVPGKTLNCPPPPDMASYLTVDKRAVLFEETARRHLPGVC